MAPQKPRRSLYEELSERFKNKSPNDVIYDIKKFSEALEDIINIKSRIIYSLFYLPNEVFWKTILATAKKEEYPHSDGLSKELRRLYYLYWVAGYTTAKIKHLSLKLIDMIKKNKKLEDIRHEIDKKIKEDNVSDLVKENLEGEAYGKSWLKPLLILVEYEMTDHSKIVYINPTRIHVDHILPQSWKEINYWKTRWSEKEANEWLNKLGNLTLVSGKKNIVASNKPFPGKKEIYEGRRYEGITPFQLSQIILKYQDWTAKEAEERHTLLLNKIKEILDI